MKKKKNDDLRKLIMIGLGQVVNTVVEEIGNHEAICGKYADGTPRSFIDAIRGDFISPEKRKKLLKKKKKKSKNKKKNDGLIKTLKKMKKENKKLMKIKK